MLPEGEALGEHQECGRGGEGEKHPPKFKKMSVLASDENRRERCYQNDAESDGRDFPVEKNKFGIVGVRKEKILGGTKVFRQGLRDLDPTLFPGSGQNIKSGKTESAGHCCNAGQKRLQLAANGASDNEKQRQRVSSDDGSGRVAEPDKCES